MFPQRPGPEWRSLSNDWLVFARDYFSTVEAGIVTTRARHRHLFERR